ncbi:MAG: hypothetical protein HYV75_04620 [Opitutae bacterium]|nr:hypothetical protein [Opitutae bacterium]
MALGAPIARGDSWNCPVCNKRFHFDPRDSYYKARWIPLHLDMHNASAANVPASQPPVDTGPSPAELARQRELEQQRQREEEAQRQREIEAERQREFERGRQQALGQLKGTSGGDIAIKAGTSNFGLKGNPSETLVIKTAPPGDQAQSLPGAWRQLNAAVVLSQKAAEAARREDWDEAAFLGEQAGQAMQGGKILVQVADVAVPGLYGAKTLTSRQTEDVRKVYDHIVKSTTERTVRLGRVQRRLPELIEHRKNAEAAVAKLAKPVEKPAPSASEPVAGEPDQPVVKAADPGAQAEAEALLRAAQEALAEATAALDDANRSIRADQAILQRNQAITTQLGEKPETAAAILAELATPTKP